MYTDEEIIKTYLSQCQIIEESTIKGDYKRGNRAVDMLKSVFKHLEKNLPQATRVLSILLKNNNIVVRSQAAAHCLSLAILQQPALEILKALANDDKFGLFSFDASMTLRVYQKQGFLKVYPDQKIAKE